MALVAFATSLTGWVLIAYLFAAFISGICIGATGVGGVALTPLLLAMDVPVGIAGSAVITSLLVTGFVATASNWHRLPQRRASLPFLEH